LHKDYASGIPIQISVYDDHLVLWNPGELPERWTLKAMLGKHPSQPFNPLLANAFFRAGYIESWGQRHRLAPARVQGAWPCQGRLSTWSTPCI